MELLISGPEGPPTTLELTKPTVSLGRSADNDLAYPADPWLSRYHLQIEKRNNAWFIKDCASRNGTVVNAQSLKEPHALHSGDRIYAGHLTIEVRDGAADVPKQPLISFVPSEEARITREATIVTSLEKLLRATPPPDVSADREQGLNTARVVAALIHAGQELAGHRPLDELFQVILKLALSAVEAKRGVIMTLEGGELMVRASLGDTFAISTSVRDRILRQKCSLVISDAQLDDAFKQQRSIMLHSVRSMMGVPLQTGDRVIGLIYVDNGAIFRPFSQEDLDLLTVMANVAAIRIEHARLIEVEQSEKLMELELAQASEIQTMLLPTGAPVYPSYDFSGHHLPCRTIGGDYYDFVPYSDGRLALVVGDVSGKGLPAALLMSSLQARVQMLKETHPDPASAVTLLNRSISERCPAGKFITFFYALLDPVTGRLSYSNAGHNYPLLIRANGAVEQLGGGGLVLGLFQIAHYEMHEVTLEPGDMLVLYSDGVTEAVNPDDEEFGEDRLAEFFWERRDKTAAEVVKELIEHLRNWHGSNSFADDFTIVLARRCPLAA